MTKEKNESNSVTADIPDSVFEEALRAVEKIQSEAKKPPKVVRSVTPAPHAASDEGELAELLQLLDDKPPSPPSPAGSQAKHAPVSATSSLESDLQILSKLLEKEYDLEREADFFRSVLYEDLAGEKHIDEGLLKVKEGQIKELVGNLKTLQAEFEKFRSRITKEAETAKLFSNEALILKLLPIVDNLERAIEHADTTEDKVAMIQGVRMILKQLIGTMTAVGLVLVEAKGKQFDPNFHEAITTVATEEVAANLVISEYQKGYLLFDRLIRPTRVVVSVTPGQDADQTPRDHTGEAAEADSEEKTNGA